MYLVIEQYNENMSPSFSKFEEKRNALDYLKMQGYRDFEEFEDNDGIKYTRAEIDYNTAFIVKVN